MIFFEVLCTKHNATKRDSCLFASLTPQHRCSTAHSSKPSTQFSPDKQPTRHREVINKQSRFTNHARGKATIAFPAEVMNFNGEKYAKNISSHADIEALPNRTIAVVRYYSSMPFKLKIAISSSKFSSHLFHLHCFFRGFCDSGLVWSRETRSTINHTAPSTRALPGPGGHIRRGKMG